MNPTENGHQERARLPEWFRVKLPHGDRFSHLRGKLKENCLHTICEEARCPNRGECWSLGTATFLLLGPSCTRGCAYCSVSHLPPTPPDPDEPEAVADAAVSLDLKYVVVTSVTRDDLPDGGASHFARTVQAIMGKIPDSRVEVLVPDFLGSRDSIGAVLDARPFVFGHNIETVRELFPEHRPQGDFSRSIRVLELAKETNPEAITKSGLMLGLGETDNQIEETLRSLRGAGVDRVSLGQYLQPDRRLAHVRRFATPAEFKRWEEFALGLGFSWVKSGPLVRSSYHAGADGKDGI